MDAAERSEVLSGIVHIEEKIDGANLGLAARDRRIVAWNRGTVLSAQAHPQFRSLWSWLASRANVLADLIGQELVLYGEWCFAAHSIRYDRLPDWFLAFDIYDRVAKQFWAVKRRDAWILQAGLELVPRVASGHFTLQELTAMLREARSAFANEPVEGFYIRRDDGDWLTTRTKLVRAEFVQSIEEHWSSGPLEKNTLRR